MVLGRHLAKDKESSKKGRRREITCTTVALHGKKNRKVIFTRAAGEKKATVNLTDDMEKRRSQRGRGIR